MGKMKVPEVSTCCGCFSLKTGTILCGAFGIIFSLIFIILMWTTNIEWKMIVDIGLSQSVIKIIMTFLFIMTIIFSSFLIIGAVKKNIIFMFPWVILTIMCIIGLVITVIFNTVVLIIDGFIWSGVILLILGIIAIVVTLYMWVVAYTYFKHVHLEKYDGQMGPYGRPYSYRHP